MSLAKSINTAIEKATDWALGRFNPRRAMLNRHARYMNQHEDYREFMEVIARSYRGADTGRNGGQWKGLMQAAADAEIIIDLPTLRSRSRELMRNDSIGAGLRKTFLSNVIGTGIRPQPRVKTGIEEFDDTVNMNLMAVWNERKDKLNPADGLDQGSLQRLIFGKIFEDGDHIIKRSKRSDSDPVFFECVEGERLGYPFSKSPDTTNEIRDGVEKDDLKIPVAYWINKQHPGDYLAFNKTVNLWDYRRVDASEVIHLKVVERPGQTRGVPFLHTVLQDIHDLDLLMIAALKRTQIAACFCAIIQSDLPMDQILPPVPISGAQAGTYGKLEQQMEPGMFLKLNPGEKIETLVPNFPVPELVPFIVILAKRIGAAVGISWQLVLKSFDGANYSSARTDLLESRQVFVLLQNWFVHNYLQPSWMWIMQDARLRGDRRLRGVTDDMLRQVTWIGNGWRWVDPTKEATATQMELAMGITTLRDVCAAAGKDWREMVDQRAYEKAYLEERGLGEMFNPDMAGKTVKQDVEEEAEEEAGEAPAKKVPEKKAA